MLNFLKNVVTGRNVHFAEVFGRAETAYHYGITQLPPPTDRIQLELLKALKLYTEATKAFAHAVFFGFDGHPAVLPDSDFRGITPSAGSRATTLSLVSLIRFSLIRDPNIADFLTTLAIQLSPREHTLEAERLSAAASIADAKACESVIVHSALGLVFPRLLSEPASYIGVVGYFSFFSAAINQHMARTLS